jgi:hypothetical protein
MMSATRKKLVGQVKDYAAKQVKAEPGSDWAKLLKLSDQQIAAVTGGTAVLEGAKGRASKFVRGDADFMEKLPKDFAKLADAKYVAEKDAAAKKAETTEAPPKPAEKPAAPAPKPETPAAPKELEKLLTVPK